MASLFSGMELGVGSISAALFPEQRLVIEPRLEVDEVGSLLSGVGCPYFRDLLADTSF